MSETIELGGQSFEIRPLKLGQLRGLLDALEEMTGKTGGALVDAAAKVVVAGLSPARPDLTVDAVLDLEATIGELNAAVAAILRVAGLAQTGEAEPVAISDPRSAPSTALSPPAADLTTDEQTN